MKYFLTSIAGIGLFCFVYGGYMLSVDKMIDPMSLITTGIVNIIMVAVILLVVKYIEDSE